MNYKDFCSLLVFIPKQYFIFNSIIIAETSFICGSDRIISCAQRQGLLDHSTILELFSVQSTPVSDRSLPAVLFVASVDSVGTCLDGHSIPVSHRTISEEL